MAFREDEAIPEILLPLLLLLLLFCMQKVDYPPQRARVTGKNGSALNGTDKMRWTKLHTDKMVLDKMVWTNWHGQNGTDQMVAIFGIDYNSSEFRTDLVAKSHK